MERTLKDRKYSITGLFKHIGAGNKIHCPVKLLYSKFGNNRMYKAKSL
ncbi:hypothetical protein ABVC73_05825 [Prevotella melaninogenica]